ncbi:5-methyltetrahydropteroyltriglutamate--homocysteine S-methyltransferase [Jeotgalibacillus proteolyticus]|uniref:5-methyltetrahydropteroyltriglutamate--homocysteine methyltransferase n=1 Tax=Jeotgalibacillus proteolyticus TaxID=2082395 RepID=A0A2S5G7G8_9BACL|nr:5-methyltetrahydropteroyltriglutamate--homocysteine S-methyltransferase [Jeotgalibacillus proteolyticus]PPA68932.1 5-methyltetrahydropteroyltriglutamate--homocysteine S-methyltransferase [Jeotgalibacillus proteolyticus]
MTSVKSSNIGYPRIGENREWKKTLEAFWSSSISEESFSIEMKKLRLSYLKNQQEKGIDFIPVGDFSYYDHVLDTAVMFGLVPNRFNHAGGKVSLSTYFSMARGSAAAHACEMTKWFDTNYHFIVPEIEDKKPELVQNKPLEAFLEAKKELNIHGKPVILGPFSFLKLAKGYDKSHFEEILQTFIPVYVQLLQELKDAGVSIVQIDEPVLVTDLSDDEMDVFSRVYNEICQHVPSLEIILQTYFEAVTHYKELISLPVKGIGLDFVRGREENLASIKKHGFPSDKLLAAGILDGRNIWKTRMEDSVSLLHELTEYVSVDQLVLQPSCSLLHVPITAENETAIHPEVKAALAFCHEKLDELTLLTKAMNHPGEDSSFLLQTQDEAINKLKASNLRERKEMNELPSKRNKVFADRFPLQHEKWKLPVLPTTTIGSFPQTKEIRKIRADWRKGELPHSTYETLIREEIKKWIEIQENIGLDVLVHGEFERNDMVEFFGEKLEGFAFSKNGWVQSYGSRCVKPPIIYGNVSFSEPMTVKETLYAQSLTGKPVKGMLTGPVTILNWSFVRNDLPEKEVAFQIAEALLNEVKSLEHAGIEMIQVDEPALREGLPLKQDKHQHYLNWAVEAFRLSTSDVADTTQIHTHMCYSDFEDIIQAISDLDADVISIETSRSHGELISSFEETTYDKGIGLGVYDIHSPRVPDEEEMSSIIERALAVLPSRLFWINPDCGLKTRNEKEVVEALTNMTSAAKKIRSSITIK